MNASLSLPRSIETISPFRHSSENRAAIPAKITGEIPSWLRGEVVRTCPVVFETEKWHAQQALVNLPSITRRSPPSEPLNTPRAPSTGRSCRCIHTSLSSALTS